MELQSGQKAPDFTSLDYSGTSHKLSDFHGMWVVLYFYPKDNTPGCTKQACAFRDSADSYLKKNAMVIGVSPDSSESHSKFINKFDLPFLLLSDTSHAISEKYGVWKEKNLYGIKKMGIVRTTFLISPNGIIEKIWNRVKVDNHVSAVLDAIPN